MWQLIDNTNGKNGGYLQITRDGVRVCDAFPFAINADKNWVTKQANRIVEAMNKIDMIGSTSLENGVERWQPIESAPKDGTQILICHASEDIGSREIEITEWCKANADREGFWNGNGHRATHWMPLPAFPASPQLQQGGK